MVTLGVRLVLRRFAWVAPAVFALAPSGALAATALASFAVSANVPAICVLSVGALMEQASRAAAPASLACGTTGSATAAPAFRRFLQHDGDRDFLVIEF